MRNLQDLKKYILEIKSVPSYYKIAVGALIFTKEDKVILIERGSDVRDSKKAKGKLEGVGGAINEGETDFHCALLREIEEELGKEVKVQIFNLLTVITKYGIDDTFWIVPIYLCRLTSGEPKNTEPNKCDTIHQLYLKDIKKSKLSSYQLETMKVYWDKYKNNPFYKKS